MKNEEFCANVLKQIGTPYSETDCIGLIRKAADIRCQGTNWLWRSYLSSGKYQYLTARLDRPPALHELRNGLLVFRIQWKQKPKGYSDTPNCYHGGVIIGTDVVQSQEATGVHKSAYRIDQWQGCGWLKQVEYPTNLEPYQEPLPPEPTKDMYPDPYELSDHEMLLALFNRYIRD